MDERDGGDIEQMVVVEREEEDEEVEWIDKILDGEECEHEERDTKVSYKNTV